VNESFSESYGARWRRPDLPVSGVGLTGCCCGGASAPAGSRYCVRGACANCNVNEPSDQRRMRALDWYDFGEVVSDDGGRRHRMVDNAVACAEKVFDASPLLW
jgi:hypothetical protein